MTTRRRLALAAAGVSCFALLGSRGPAPDFPDGYRRWTHVSTTLIGPENQQLMSEHGIHHVYANDRAVEGLRAGRFADGASLVYDLLTTRTENGATRAGERRRLDVMVKDSARYHETGGWGFESFVGGDRNAPRVGDRAATMCWGCHASRTSNGVFSVYRE